MSKSSHVTTVVVESNGAQEMEAGAVTASGRRKHRRGQRVLRRTNEEEEDVQVQVERGQSGVVAAGDDSRRLRDAAAVADGRFRDLATGTEPEALIGGGCFEDVTAQWSSSGENDSGISSVRATEEEKGEYLVSLSRPVVH